MTHDLILKAAFFLEPHSLKLSRDVALGIDGSMISAQYSQADDVPDAKQVIECDDAIIAPAFINTHAHLDLSHLRSMPLDGEDFGNWLAAVVASRSAPVSVIETAAELSISEALSTGCAGILDILATNPGAEEVAQAFFKSGIRTALAVEILSPDPSAEEFMFGNTKALIEKLEAALLHHTNEEMIDYRKRLRDGQRSPQISLSPHAPYSVSPKLYKEISAYSKKRGMLQTTHMNESLAEREFMTTGGGKMDALYAAMGLDTAKMRWTDRDGLTTWIEEVFPTIQEGQNATIHAHCYDLTDDNVAQLGSNRQTVAYCPRSRRYFGHPDFRMADLLEAGARVTIGTDSLGSTDNLNLMHELQAAKEDLKGSVSPEALFRSATTEGQRAVFTPKAKDQDLAEIADLQVLRSPTGWNGDVGALIDEAPLCVMTVVDGRIRFRHL